MRHSRSEGQKVRSWRRLDAAILISPSSREVRKDASERINTAPEDEMKCNILISRPLSSHFGVVRFTVTHQNTDRTDAGERQRCATDERPLATLRHQGNRTLNVMLECIKYLSGVKGMRDTGMNCSLMP